MKVFILYYGVVDSNGELMIDCEQFFDIKKAQYTQNLIIKDFIDKHSYINEEMIEEKFCSFIKISYMN